MKHATFPTTLAFEGDLPFSPPASFEGQDRNTGISKAAAAVGAARNVAESGLSPAQVAALGRSIMRCVQAGKPIRIGKLLKKHGIKRLPSLPDGEHYRRGANLDPARLDHKSYVQTLLSFTGDGELSKEILSRLGGREARTHSNALEILRREHPVLHSLLVRNKVPEALDHVIGLGLKTETSTDLMGDIRAHVKYYAIRTAHDFAHSLTEISLLPYGFSFSGFRTWKNTGHVILATIAAPASVIRRLAEADAAGALKAKTDKELWTSLVKNKILPDSPAGQFVIDAAKIARSSLTPAVRQTSARHRGTFLRFVTTRTSYGANLCRGHMQQDGVAQQPFLEHRVRLSASEAASYIAMELVRICEQIDGCVDAALKGKLLPPPAKGVPCVVYIAYPAMLLRADAQCDRNAVKPRYDDKGPRIGFNPDHLTARGPVGSMIEKIEDPEVAKLARKSFGMDTRFWFRRPAFARALNFR